MRLSKSVSLCRNRLQHLVYGESQEGEDLGLVGELAPNAHG